MQVRLDEQGRNAVEIGASEILLPSFLNVSMGYFLQESSIAQNDTTRHDTIARQHSTIPTILCEALLSRECEPDATNGAMGQESSQTAAPDASL